MKKILVCLLHISLATPIACMHEQHTVLRSISIPNTPDDDDDTINIVTLPSSRWADAKKLLINAIEESPLEARMAPSDAQRINNDKFREFFDWQTEDGKWMIFAHHY